MAVKRLKCHQLLLSYSDEGIGSSYHHNRRSSKPTHHNGIKLPNITVSSASTPSKQDSILKSWSSRYKT